MKTVFLDIGNSHVKLAKFQNGKWISLFKAGIENTAGLTDTLAGLARQEPVTVLTSSVRKDILNTLQNELPSVDLIRLTTKDIPQALLDYNTPETLGVDRFLACYGAAGFSSGRVIVVDAGSACTIDEMTAGMIYRGGVIMPGLRIFHQAVRNYFPELPDVDSSIPSDWPGKSTVESLQWGINGAFLMAVKSLIDKYLGSGEPAEIFVTGGDAHFLSVFLNKKGYTVIFEPNLVFEGMRKLREKGME